MEKSRFLIEFEKYEKMVIEKFSKLSAYMVDNLEPEQFERYTNFLVNTRGQNKKNQIELMDKKIEKVVKEIGCIL